MMTYYIYALVDPRDDLPFYVGKGKKNRTDMHFFPSMKDHNKYKDNIIAKIKSLDLEVGVVKVYENIESEDEAYELEAHIIKTLGRRNIDPNGILTNICIDQRPPINPGPKAYQFDHTVRTFLNINGGKFVGNRSEFVTHSGFHKTTVGEMINGKIKSIKGWYLEGTDLSEVYVRNGGERKNRRDTRIFTFYNVDGKTFTGTQYEFCALYGLGKPAVYNLISGVNKESKGWYLKGTDPNTLGVRSGEQHPLADLTQYNFTNVDGRTFTGTRIGFRDYTGIDSRMVHALLSKTVRVTDGWHLSHVDPNQRNQTAKNKVFHFSKEDESFIGSSKDFSNTFNIDCSSISKLVLGKVKSAKGWKIV